jgi:hypothetical protein
MGTAEPDTPAAQLRVLGNSPSPISSIALSRRVLAWLAPTGSGTAPNADYFWRPGDSRGLATVHRCSSSVPSSRRTPHPHCGVTERSRSGDDERHAAFCR